MIKNAMSSSFGGYNFLLTFVMSLPVFLLDFFVILIGPLWLAIAFLPAFNSVNLLWMINKLYKAMQNGVVVTNEFSIEQVQELKKKYLIAGIIGILLFAYFIFRVVMSFYLISLIIKARELISCFFNFHILIHIHIIERNLRFGYLVFLNLHKYP